MFSTKISKVLVPFVVIGLSFALTDCRKKSSSDDSSSAATSSGGSSGSSSSDDSTAALSEGGKSSGYVTSGYAGVGTLALSSGLFFNLADTNGCESGTYSIAAVGYSTAFSSGSFSGSTFTDVSAPNKDAVITLACSDGTSQRCFVKAGDSGVLCNKVADSIIGAFESALGKDLGDSSFRGAAISKIASSIVSATEIAGPETEQFVSDLKTCKTASDPKACYTTALSASPFFDAFKIMQQITTGWTPEGLILFVTGVLGRTIELDSELYGPLFDSLASARGDGFIEAIRELLAKVVKSQVAQDGKYAFGIKCSVSINGDVKYFEPDLNSKDQVTCNRTDLDEILTSVGISSTQYGAEIAGDKLRGEVSCTYAKAFNGKCHVRLNVVAVALSTEADRNDVDGTHTSDRGESSRSVSMVNVMPQVMNAIKKHGIDIGEDGPPDISDANRSKFAAAMAESKNYFLGLMGVYKFINDASVKSVKLSLNDLHEIFVDESFMTSRLVGWGPGVSGVQVSSSNGQKFYPTILSPTSDLGIVSFPDTFKWTFGSSSQTSITTAAFDTLIADSEPKFEQTFGMFTEIPTAKEIGDFVFSSSHHEDWNPMGSKYIFVAEFGQTGRPITCKMEKAGPGQSMVAETSISCDATQTSVTCDSDGSCTFPDGYAYPYVLMERGWYGEDKGRMFAFGSRTTGLELRSNGGRGVLVKEYKSGNDKGKCDSSQVGKVIKYLEEFFCGPNVKCQEKTTAFCLDMSAFGTPSRKRFYPGGQLTVSNQDQQGNRWEWQVPLIGAYNGSDHSKDYPVCLHVPQGTFVSGTSSALATANVNTSTGALTLSGVSSASVKDCEDDAASGATKYYLYNWKDFSGSDTMVVWLLDAQQKNTVQFKSQAASNANWETTYAYLTQAQVEALLSGKTIAGSAATQINGMRFRNPRHDEKFDPYCDDLNGNGKCDCYPLKTISEDRKTVTFESTVRSDANECSLMDKTAEPTISELPYCAQCPGASDAKGFFTQFGGKAGADLSGVATYFQSHHPNFNVQAAVFCQYKFADQSQVGQPKYVDWGHFEAATHPGCPASAGATKTDNTQGPIRIINPQMMRNAFNIGRPNTLLKLINYATKSVGQGVKVAADEKAFSLDEAMALIALRNFLPIEVKVQDSSGTDYPGIAPSFQGIERSNHGSDPFSAMVKGLMYKAGVFSAADLEVTEE